MAKFGVVLAAAGQSRRFGHRVHKKPFMPLNGKPVWLHAAEQFTCRDDVVGIVLVVDSADRDMVVEQFGGELSRWGIALANGGAERADSVQNGLAAIPEEANYIAVHDAARPCITGDVVERAFAAAVQSGACTVGIPVTSTVKRVGSDEVIAETVSRDGLWLSQTPQVARRDLLERAFAARGGFQPTDEAQMLERAGIPVKMVLGSLHNLKITTPDDFQMAQWMLQSISSKAKP